MRRQACTLIGILALLSFSPVIVTAQPATTSPSTATTKPFIYKKIKDVELEMIVHYPPGWTERDKRPAIVFFFGGGWTNGTIQAFESQATYLAGRGMVAARADYRVKSRQGVTPKECVEDAKSAVRWLRQNAVKLGIDPDRIVASGGSAGGHIAACTTFTPGLDADGEDTSISCKANALVLFNPVLRFGPQMTQERLGNDQALAKALSPTEHLEKDSPPTLLLYGTADFLMTQGDEFMKRSRELGHKAEIFLAEGQQHGFFNKPPWKEKTTRKMAEFLESIGYLSPGKPAAEPASDRPSHPAAFDIKCRKDDDAVKVSTEAGKTILSITSPSGIGGAVIERKADPWPDELVLRVYLHGLESLDISGADATLQASVLSHGGHRLLHLSRDGKEGPELTTQGPYWMEIRALDARGKPMDGLPETGGYFEMTIPKALLVNGNKTLTLAWIDFYR